MYKFIYTFSIIGFFLVFTCCNQEADKDSVLEVGSKPNIIYILADDLGYGDVGFNGQKKFKTPNIDEMAAEGMIFTDHYSGSTVCAPSRSTLMTGQHTGHTPIRGNKELPFEGQLPLPDSTITLPEILKEAGYVTGGFGKWGLGFPASEGDPNNQGIDEFYGYNCQRHAHNYYPYYLWENQTKVFLEGNEEASTQTYAPILIHKKALEFIEANRDTTFFMYYPTIIPHAELLAPEIYMEKYRGKLEPEKSYKGVEYGAPGYKAGKYSSQPETHAAYAAMITLLDDQVGEILDKLRELGIAENTLVIFTSDNGPGIGTGADPDYFDSNGPFRGYKRDLYEGGIRVPMVTWWPGTIEKGTTSDHVSAFWDVLPTIADLTGVEAPESIDGISMLPCMLGKGEQKKHDYLYWEFNSRGGRKAIRKDNWKAVKYNVRTNPNAKIELYDLTVDTSESNNIADQYPDIVEEMEQLMQQSRTPSEVFTFEPKASSGKNK